MAARRGRWILIALSAALAVSLWRAVAVEREKERLAAAYEEAARLTKELERERAHLTSELTASQQTIQGQADSLANLRQEVVAVQGQLDDTMKHLAALQREHNELQQEHLATSEQLDSVTSEKQDLLAKFSDIKQLKLAIKDVRRKVWAQRWEGWRARAAAQRERDLQILAAGNRGFVVRDGATTLSSARKLQVHVLEPQPQ